MTGSDHKSIKNNESHRKRSNGSYLPSDKNKQRSVLKERHCKEDSSEKNKRNHSNKDHHSSSKKEKSSDHKSRHNHHRSLDSSKHKKEEDKSKNKKKHDEEESYEELSRKKRKIESELHALDLEEAAQREAEKKKTISKDASEDKQPKTKVRVKEEPKSDEEQPANRKEKAKNRIIKKEPEDDSADTSEGRWGDKKTEKPKEKPNFSTSGKLAEDTNMYNGVVIKYNEPAEARKPRRRWRLYPFKGDTDLPFIPIHRQSAYLFGRTRKIADIPIDHPSCSKQHAVLQFRLVTYKRDDGTKGRRVRPYIIDLESSNGTFVNNKRIDARCYVELMEKDVVKFGFSTREYVVLHEESKNDDEDDDVLDSN